MDDVPIVDDMAVSAVRWGPPVPRGENWRRALEALEPIVMKVDPQPLADQSRGNRVEHLAQREGAEAGDVDVDLLVVYRLEEWQLFQRDPFLVDALGVAGVAAADDPSTKPRHAGRSSKSREARSNRASASALLRWPWALSIEPFSWLTPGLLRVGVMP